MGTSQTGDGLDRIWSRLDADGRSAGVFFPRRARTPAGKNATDYDIPVEPGVTLGARWHLFDARDPTVLCFHGNGETVSDYDDTAAAWHLLGLNLFTVDYRGYGWSGGAPTLRSLYEDPAKVAQFFLKELASKNPGKSPAKTADKSSGKSSDKSAGHNVASKPDKTAGKPTSEAVHQPRPLLFGRSLGSSPATRIAVDFGSDFRALIIESGFGQVGKLLDLFRIDTGILHDDVDSLLSNTELLKRVKIPVLLLHGSRDQLLPPAHARANYASIPHDKKVLSMVEGAGHNDILSFADAYFGAIRAFLQRY